MLLPGCTTIKGWFWPKPAEPPQPAKPVTCASRCADDGSKCRKKARAQLRRGRATREVSEAFGNYRASRREVAEERDEALFALDECAAKREDCLIACSDVAPEADPLTTQTTGL